MTKVLVIIGLCVGLVALLRMAETAKEAKEKRRAESVEEWIYHTASGHPCTERDRERQLLHDLQAGEEKCLADMVRRPMTDQEKVEAARQREEQRKAKAEAIRANCVLLSQTPMSAMTPSDLREWRFCKSIMRGY